MTSYLLLLYIIRWIMKSYYTFSYFRYINCPVLFQSLSLRWLLNPRCRRPKTNVLIAILRDVCEVSAISLTRESVTINLHHQVITFKLICVKAVADPGFPKAEAPTSKVVVLTYCIGHFFLKLHKNFKKWS